MVTKRSVVLNGDLGSGKSTVSIMLAEKLGVRRVSVGDLYRALAAQLGMSAVEINLHAQLDDKIDHYVDQLQRDIAASGEQLVVDSRLAWHFFSNAVKVHLITESTVAAHRVLGRPADNVESYASVEEARSRLAIRSESERVRFLSRYEVDKTRLRNYDLVCDSTRATPQQIVDKIITYLVSESDHLSKPVCYLDPRRIYPTAEPVSSGQNYDDGDLIDVAYVSPSFFAVGSHRNLSAALEAGAPLAGARLIAEADMSIDTMSCVDYLHAEVTPSRIGAWEAAYEVRLPQWSSRLG